MRRSSAARHFGARHISATTQLATAHSPPSADRCRFASQSHSREPYGRWARHPNILVGDTANTPPEFVGGIAEQGRRCADREVFASPADGLLQGAHCQPG